MNKKYTALACCLSVFALSACNSTGDIQQTNANQPYDGAPRIASKIEKQGVINNIRVTDLRQVRRDNLIHIQAEISNITNENQQLYYRFKWLDQNGFDASKAEVWKPLLVYGSQKKTIHAISPTFNTVDFRLILQSSEMYAKESKLHR